MVHVGLLLQAINCPVMISMPSYCAQPPAQYHHQSPVWLIIDEYFVYIYVWFYAYVCAVWSCVMSALWGRDQFSLQMLSLSCIFWLYHHRAKVAYRELRVVVVVVVVVSASLSISIASGALMLQTCCLDHLCVCVCVFVCVCVCPESVLWQNGWLDPNAIWGGERGRLRNGCIRWVDDRRSRRGSFASEFGASHCNQWGLCEALFSNYFEHLLLVICFLAYNSTMVPSRCKVTIGH